MLHVQFSHRLKIVIREMEEFKLPFKVERDINLCRRNFDRPGCCWYMCDNRDEELCKNCYSCVNNCPHDVYEIITMNHIHYTMKIVLDAGSAKKCALTMQSKLMLSQKTGEMFGPLRT